MKRCLRTQVLLWKTDFFSFFRDRKKGILLYTTVLLLGVTLGIFVGYKLGEQDAPVGVFALIFHSEFNPFSFLFIETIRFSVLSGLCILCYFLPIWQFYPIFALLLFGKHFGEVACLSFLTDELASFILSLFFLYLPLLLIGGLLLTWIALQEGQYRICNGGFACKSNLKSAFRVFLTAIALYLFLSFIFAVILCGIVQFIAVGI